MKYELRIEMLKREGKSISFATWGEVEHVRTELIGFAELFFTDNDCLLLDIKLVPESDMRKTIEEQQQIIADLQIENAQQRKLALEDECVCGHILNNHPGQYGSCTECRCSHWRKLIV